MHRTKIRNKSFLICFTGIDGSGKTTISKGLAKLLNEKGFRFKYVHARLNPFISRPLILIGRWMFLRKKDIFKNYSEYADKRRKAIRKYVLFSRVYQKILLLDYFLQILFKVKFPLAFGKSIVCDRYVYDTIINDLLMDINLRGKIVNLLNSYLHIFPKPNIVFLVDVPEETAFRRKNDIPSIEYLRERREIYLEVGKEYGMKILDGSEELKRLQEDIEKEVLCRISRLTIE